MNLAGYGLVEAVEAHGDIGKIDEATNKVGGSYIVVDTGPWIFGKKVLLPAGVATRDYDDEKVFVNRTKEQIKKAPEFDDRIDTGTRATERGRWLLRPRRRGLQRLIESSSGGACAAPPESP